ncbi:sensor histidine kinase [Cryobacterium fucosi]|uniref:histidine kinase n=1 Tax=Cryobacterium fucosi TaxID=1259157 RepID=A0A4R9BDR6_9MICO|nr:ATP-binding protein [Cryobacterium fucosi]TFD82015.1 ATP-binding protein [Cryobacterium fucosi]
MAAAKSAAALPLRIPRAERGTRDKIASGGGPETPGRGSDLIGGPTQPRNPISRTRIETVVSRSVAGVGVIFSLQALPIMLAQVHLRLPILAVAMPLALAVGIGAVLVAAVIKVGVRVTTGTVAVVYLAALVAWPFLMRDPSAVLDGKPWLWYMCTVATACAAVSFPLVWAAIYTFLAPIVYGIVRTQPSGGGADVLLASLDTVYATILGQVILIIIFMLRQTAAAVDAAQTNALYQYATAVRQHATEVERVQVDSIVHDSVLATFLAAAAAGSPKAAQLASGMASDALTRLNDAAVVPAGNDGLVPFNSLTVRIREAAEKLAAPFTFVECEIDTLSIPVHASDALFAASVQAMVNSVQHAGDGIVEPGRTLTMRANAQGGCTIEIADTGVGFDPEHVPSERLGLRLSIQERVASAGGSVQIRSEIGRGTTITIDWPPEAAEAAA